MERYQENSRETRRVRDVRAILAHLQETTPDIPPAVETPVVEPVVEHGFRIRKLPFGWEADYE